MKSNYFIALLGTLSLAAFGCAGDFESGPIADMTPDATVIPPIVPDADTGGGGSDQDTAKALFEANVRGVIIAGCSPGGACHSSQDPAFVASDITLAYTKINNFKERLFPGYISLNSDLLSYGTGGHKGATFSAGDVEAIQAWLAQEKLDVDNGGGGVLPSALAVWSGCMDLDDWKERNVAKQWANKQAGNQGNCEKCHRLGADGYIASNSAEQVFNYITTKPALMPSYFTLDATGTKVLINRARLESVGLSLEPHEAHGGFNVEGGAMNALEIFYNKTKERLDAGQCEAPRF